MTEFNNNNKYIPKAPETFQVAYLETNQEIKKSPLSPAARSKVIRKWGGGYVSENQESYGPCHNCSGENKKLKFHLKIVLKNCVGGEIGGTVYSTSAAEKAVREIKNAEGHWAGNAKTSAFSQSNRDMLADWVTGVVDRHKNGENIDETAEVGG